MLWLPLVAANFKRSKELAAPLDIAWVWHVHMLSPEAYAAVSLKRKLSVAIEKTSDGGPD